MQGKELSYQEVLEAKQYIKNSVSYPSASQYLDTFLETVKGQNIVFHGAKEVENANEDGTKNIAYGRILAIATEPIEGREDVTYSRGIILALDMVKPEMQIFSGFQVQACTNMSIFQPDDIKKVPQADLLGYDYLIKELEEGNQSRIKEYLETIEMLETTILNTRDRHELMGYLLELSFTQKGNLAFSNRIVNYAAEYFNTKGSLYYVEEGADTTMWNVYNALTEAAGTQEFTTMPQRILGVSRELAKWMGERADSAVVLGGGSEAPKTEAKVLVENIGEMRNTKPAEDTTEVVKPVDTIAAFEAEKPAVPTSEDIEEEPEEIQNFNVPKKDSGLFNSGPSNTITEFNEED